MLPFGRYCKLVPLAAAWLGAVAACADDVRIDVRADRPQGAVSRYLTGACIEDVNHEIYGGLYSQMLFGESFQEPPLKQPAAAAEVSGMWRLVSGGSAKGRFSLTKVRAFVGAQAQQIELDSGEGRWGIENQGLNRWGLNFAKGQPYDGYIWARVEQPTVIFASLESRDGSQVYAETKLTVAAGGWQRLDFRLMPSAADAASCFALTLHQPGSITVGHAFLQPGEWGRFKGLPVRRDVAVGLIDQGIAVLRYGGSMVNAPGYRWKNMIGPRDRRPPYQGTWYRYSSNGWGIVDFMDFCEAAGFQYVPAFNMGETPEDMADFIEYARGAADSAWGRRRAADGHPEPYRLHYIELGNEERVDEKYAAHFEALATAIWAKDPEIILVVGDFAYGERISDPFHLRGADSRITSLAGQQQILQLAKQRGREVWFDVHVNTDKPQQPNPSLDGMFSFNDALAKIADGAKFKVVVFELNSGNHAMRRALANAQALLAIERDGRIPICTSANCLQPDGQNDNGWDQGLLFLNPSRVWLQPPSYVTQMLSRNYEPQRVQCDVSGGTEKPDAIATQSADHKTLVLQVVNAGERAAATQIGLTGFIPAKPQVEVTELSGSLDAVNTAKQPTNVTPKSSRWEPKLQGGQTRYTFPPRSFTILRFE